MHVYCRYITTMEESNIRDSTVCPPVLAIVGDKHVEVSSVLGKSHNPPHISYAKICPGLYRYGRTNSTGFQTYLSALPRVCKNNLSTSGSKPRDESVVN
jgi:hypothetical protein